VFYSIRSMDRRVFLQSGFAAAGVTLLGGRRLMDNPPTPLVVYKSPSCGCCAKWVDHAKAAGFAVEIHDVEDVNVIKKKHGVPNELSSCHTALADGYFFEGHIPADLILKVLKEKPKIAGLAAPGMPVGSPGMEMGGRKDAFKVIALGRDGRTSVYAVR
jgi:hypothetical protein